MKIGILGTGTVAQSLAAALISQQHEVVLGTRDVAKTAVNTELNGYGMPGYATWAAENPAATLATFHDAAAHGELLILATNGEHALTALAAAGTEQLGTKILIDVTNPLDFSKGMPPTLFVSNDDSLGEQIQREYPNVRVVKSLNTMNNQIMLNPASLGAADHTVFVSGNDEAAKAEVTALLTQFGWTDILDLGDISTARGTEGILPLWLRLWGSLGTPAYQFKVVR